MIVGIHQPNFLPWLGYFYKMVVCDHFVLLDNVAFSKGSYTNRVQIKTPQGPAWLTVPAKTSGKLGQDIADVSVDPSPAWRRKVQGTLENSYRQAPHFKAYWPGVLEIIQSPMQSLCELNIALIAHVAALLEIHTPTGRSSQMAARGASTELLIGLCRELGADTYLSGSGGANYQDEQAFAAAGIKVVYAGYRHPTYPQQHGEFAKGLSALDLLFNCGPAAAEILRSGRPAGQTPVEPIP